MGGQRSHRRRRVLKKPAIVAITHRADVSADLVIAECEDRGVDIFRFNTEDYPRTVRLSADPLDPHHAVLTRHDEGIDISTAGIWVWRPQWPQIEPSLADEFDRQIAKQEAVAALGGLLRLLAIRCVSPPGPMQEARWKIPQLSVANRLGLKVPPTIVTSDPDTARTFASVGPTVVKAVADARVTIGDQVRAGYVNDLAAVPDWSSVSLTPVLLQRHVDKVADLRVTAVGKRLFAVKVTPPPGSDVDIRAANPESCIYEAIEIGGPLATKCQDFLAAFGLRFGAFDFAVAADGEPWFLECNPAGQWGWLEHYTGVPITASLVDLLLSLR